MHLVSSFEDLVQQISLTMTNPTFASFVLLVAGWLFARRHTVTGALVAAGEVRRKHHSAFHRVFATARWSLDAMGLALLALARPLAAAEGTAFLVLDDTLARKRGRKVYGVGMHHDPLISSRGRSLVNWGHSWVILSLLVRLPLLPDRWFALPFLFRLYRSKQTVAREGGSYRTRPERAVQMLRLVAERYPGQPFHVLGDATYSGQSVVKNLPQGWNLTGRLHPRAALYAPPPTPRAGTRGRRRKRGVRLPSPVEMLERGPAPPLTLDLYGRHERARIATAQALWYATAGSRLLRIVAVEPLSTGRPRQAFYSTCAEALPVEVLAWFARRWALEVTIHEAKQHLGFEEPQGWTRRAVERTAPVAMLLYSLIVLWFAHEGHRQVSFPNRPWYRQKREPSFADMLAALRRACLRQTFLQTPVGDRRSKKIIQSLVTLCSSAA
jgi:hypothetical protein